MFNIAEMLNRRASAHKFKPNEVIKELEIKKNDCIADIGSGGGYYTFRFASQVGLDGTVYAVDMNKKLLKYVDDKAKNTGMTNVKTILINDKLTGLPERGCDLIFLRNVFHHLDNPVTYFKDISCFLKEKGKIVIIDYKKKKSISFINLFKHSADEKNIISSLEKAGYKHVKSYDFIEEQSFNIFEIK